MNLVTSIFIIFASIFNVSGTKSMATPEKTLHLSLKKIDERSVEVRLTNVSKQVVRLYSYVETGVERHYDNFEIVLLTPDNEQMYLSFYADRDKSASIIVELKPNENLTHTIDLVFWANHYVNHSELQKIGLFHLSSINSLKAKARYFNQPCQDCAEYYQAIWSGYCESEWTK
jgi:hypothetical protein